MSSRDPIRLFSIALIAISMALDHPSLLMRAMQMEEIRGYKKSNPRALLDLLIETLLSSLLL